ncbi:hsp90 co-chaperone Cdc37 [Centruroides vittatus]|uniref:hsp90 co-chaperone Cdc37 n=1 Tax=Centruroides vittatus TaxID=120091 RepID=UPI00350FAF74
MVDYSKWKEIEISDDEDDTHPNIDTASLFRWRHQARLERMTEFEKEKTTLENSIAESQKKITELKNKLKEGEGTGIDLCAIKKSIAELEDEEKKLKAKNTELLKKEKLMPWNVDTISRDGFSKTVLNKNTPRVKEELTEEEREARQKKFIEENESLLKKFGMLRKYDDSKRFLQDHPFLACEETANYLVMWCINLEVEEKHKLMEHVAHQCICMQYILELAKQLDTDPRACVASFFSRIQLTDQQYKDAFDDELQAFKQRVKDRAEACIQKIAKEIEEEEREKNLGPGGLDSVEVFESLPEKMKECFEKRDIGMLQEVIAQMPEEEARYHMKRCVDSGLWIPDAKAAEKITENPTKDE